LPGEAHEGAFGEGRVRFRARPCGRAGPAAGGR